MKQLTQEECDRLFGVFILGMIVGIIIAASFVLTY